MAEVAGLEHALLVVEEQANAVSRVKALGLDLLVGQKRDVGISVPEQWNELFAHSAGQPTAMAFLKPHRVGEPADDVADRADWELDQHLALGGGIVVAEQALALGPDLEAEAHEITLGTVYAPSLEFGLEEDAAGVEVAEAHAPGMVTLGQYDPAAVVEIEADSFGGFLRGNVGRQ